MGYIKLSRRGTRPTLVSVLGRVVLGRDYQTTALTGTSIHRFHNVDHLLLVLQWPVDLVVVTRAQIDHNVLVAEEEHHRARIVQLVHLVEVRHLGNVDQIDDSEVLHFLGDAVHDLIHFHAGGVPIVTETYYLEGKQCWLLMSDG